MRSTLKCDIIHPKGYLGKADEKENCVYIGCGSV